MSFFQFVTISTDTTPTSLSELLSTMFYPICPVAFGSVSFHLSKLSLHNAVAFSSLSDLSQFELHLSNKSNALVPFINSPFLWLYYLLLLLIFSLFSSQLFIISFLHITLFNIVVVVYLFIGVISGLLSMFYSIDSSSSLLLMHLNLPQDRWSRSHLKPTTCIILVFWAVDSV